MALYLDYRLCLRLSLLIVLSNFLRSLREYSMFLNLVKLLSMKF